MKILLLGKNGQVGWELQRSLAPLGHVIALDRDSTSWCGSFVDLERLADTVQRIAPDAIVNAAAYTAVDRAESEPDLARTVNALAPGVLAREAERLGAWLVHYSTDYVFDGSGIEPWKESDPTGPLNAYGATKLEGELAVAQCTKHLIFRTSWVYASRGANFIKTILRLAGEREQLRVIDDQVGAPTGAELLADVTAHAVRCVREREDLAGCYHLAAGGETTWYAYARHVTDCARRAGRELRVQPAGIEAVPTTAFPSPARRPLNSRLDTSKLRTAFGLQMPDWHSGVERVLAELLD